MKLVKRQFDASILGFPATMIEREDGGPVRLITNGRQKKPVGAYYSQKLGRSVSWESRNELHAFHTAEVSTEVVRYRAQPSTVEMIIHGHRRSYTPDREDTMSDGRKVIVEVKDDAEAAKEPGYEEKLEYARAVFAALGVGFRIQTKAEIEAQPRFDAVERIQSLRRTLITTEDTLILMQVFAGRTTVALSDFSRAYKSAKLGLAKASAMMIRRTIALDLTRPLGPDTPICLVDRKAGG